jgi:DNA-binding transcriptional ArsR family regulator
MAFVFRALSNGTDGVFIGGCHLGDCHYNTQGNYDALRMVLLSKKIMEHIGLNPERLRIEWVSAGEGIRFAEVMNDFAAKVKELGPLGQGEGIHQNALRLKLNAVTRLIPYIRVVQNERLRVRFNTEAEYQEFYSGKEFDRLFRALIADKLAISQIMLLLREKPLSAGEMAKILDLTPSEVSRQLNSSATHGLVRYEESQKRFALA